MNAFFQSVWRPIKRLLCYNNAVLLIFQLSINIYIDKFVLLKKSIVKHIWSNLYKYTFRFTIKYKSNA
jgi:hypothetical protein